MEAQTGGFGNFTSPGNTLTLDLYPGGNEDHAASANGSRIDDGSGSGTITVNGTTGGSINATFDDGVTVSGTWKCQ
jgi:hypothetical protein